MMFRIVIPLLLALASSCPAAESVIAPDAPAPVENVAPAADWLAHLRPGHPRIFFNVDTLDEIADYVRTVEKDYYAQVRRTVAAIPLEPDRETCEGGTNNLYGLYAQQAAFVWLLEGDREALAKARNYLLAGVEFYQRCSSAGKAVHWFSAGRVGALMAYDWVYSELSPAQRRTVAEGFLRHYQQALGGKRFPRQNRSNHETGFYGVTNLAWYVGLAFDGDGLIDDEARALLLKGYADHMRLLNYRRKAAGDEGGTGTIALSYGLGMYPWSEFNFMHTYQSATGLRMQDSFDHLSLLAEWVAWNVLPGRQCFGLGDGSPGGAFSDGFLDMHMLNAAHFYAERHPERAAKAMYVREKLLSSREHDNYWWPLAPFFVTRCATLAEPVGPESGWPLVRNFRNLGVIFMRSNWTDDAVCALFQAGGQINNHRHYAQGHFAILDGEHLTGSSGHYGPRRRNDHLTEYFYRTVAANSLLIRADAEHDKPAKVWGGPAVTLDGGQYRHDARQAAFSTSEHYSYAAVDMTSAYYARKCRLAVRQFVFVHPDTFFIFDRVETTRPDFEKLWLLHAVEKPELTGEGRFRLIGETKELQGRMLLPEQARFELVGGEGKEYFSAGANHPQTGKTPKLAGRWRIEAAAPTDKTYDVFLTVLRTAPLGTEPLDAQLLRDDELVGASVKRPDNQGDITVFFNRRGLVSGRVQIRDAKGHEILNSPLAEDIQR